MAALLLACALVTSPAHAVSKKSSATALARAEAVDRLGADFRRLVYSMGDFLREAGIPPLLWPQAAHSRLAREAGLFDGAGDALGALLLRDFARRMPLAGLLDPLTSKGPASLGNLTSGISDSVEIRSNGKGQLVKKIVHCENGNCTNTTEVVDPAERQLPMASAVDVQQAMRSLTDNLKELSDGLGLGKFQDLFKDVFAAPFAGEAAVDGDLPAAMPPQPAAFGDGFGGVLGRILSDMFGDAANVSTREVNSSTVTRVKDGKLVQETTRCEDGRCVKQTREEELPKVNGSSTPL